MKCECATRLLGLRSPSHVIPVCFLSLSSSFLTHEPFASRVLTCEILTWNSNLTMSARLIASSRSLLLPVLRSCHPIRSLCSTDLDERPFGYYVPIRKPPPEPARSNINRITDSVPLDPFTTDIDPEYLITVAPEHKISYNLAAFVNRSSTLQQLVNLGVDVSQFDQDPEVSSYVLQLNWEKDIKGHISALHEIGIPARRLGDFITDNPLIFQVSLHNIAARVEYLRSKKFGKKAIIKILTTYPRYLNYTVKEVDARLGFVQQEFSFSGNQVRSILTKYPGVLALPTMNIRYTKLAISDLMGFDKTATRIIVSRQPAILSQVVRKIVNIFDVIYNIAGIQHEIIVKFPQVFLSDLKTVKDRVEYLKLIGKDQFDPTEPLYIPLTAIAVVTDEEFATKFARTSVDDYDLFLKNR